MKCGHHAASTDHHRDPAGASNIPRINITALYQPASIGAAEPDSLASVSCVQRYIGICQNEFQYSSSDAPLSEAAATVLAREVGLCVHRNPFR
jgi:hypothetical protein